MKPISKFFEEDLSAPLHNKMWSWGARDLAGRVVLRVWNDELRRVPGQNGWWVSVDYDKDPSNTQNNGLNERREHLSSTRAGVPTACIVYQREEGSKEKIKGYLPDIVWVLTSQTCVVYNEVLYRVACNTTVERWMSSI